MVIHEQSAERSAFGDKVTVSEGIPVNVGPLWKVKELFHFENKI